MKTLIHRTTRIALKRVVKVYIETKILKKLENF